MTMKNQEQPDSTFQTIVNALIQSHGGRQAVYGIRVNGKNIFFAGISPDEKNTISKQRVCHAVADTLAGHTKPTDHIKIELLFLKGRIDSYPQEIEFNIPQEHTP